MNLNASEIISLIILRIGKRINFINLCPVPEKLVTGNLGGNVAGGVGSL